VGLQRNEFTREPIWANTKRKIGKNTSPAAVWGALGGSTVALRWEEKFLWSEWLSTMWQRCL